jgi:lipoprotein-releasing system ATP-binding protein
MTNDLILSATDLSKRYAVAGRVDVEVFRNLTLELRRGELTVLLGPSGSGKSTLLHLLGTLDRPTSGKIVIDGVDLSSMNDKALSDFRNRHISFIFQFHHLLPEFTAVENVAMPALIGGQSFDQVRDRAVELLTDVGLGHRLDHRPSALSGGEAQRVAVARAFLMRPALIFADEPTGNLDTRNSQLLFDIILQLSRKHTQTFLIATHNLDLSQKADRVLELENGVLVERSSASVAEQETAGPS